jgi:hypothetical protein
MDEEAYKKHNRPERGGQPGVYKHPLTGTELHATSFPMADAFIRQGWEYDRELPKDEPVKEAGAPSATDVAPNAGADVEALRAQLAAAEKERDELRAQAEANKEAEAKLSAQSNEDTVKRTRKQRELNEATTKTDEKEAEAEKESK